MPKGKGSKKRTPFVFTPTATEDTNTPVAEDNISTIVNEKEQVPESNSVEPKIDGDTVTRAARGSVDSFEDGDSVLELIPVRSVDGADVLRVVNKRIRNLLKKVSKLNTAQAQLEEDPTGVNPDQKEALSNRKTVDLLVGEYNKLQALLADLPSSAHTRPTSAKPEANTVARGRSGANNTETSEESQHDTARQYGVEFDMPLPESTRGHVIQFGRLGDESPALPPAAQPAAAASATPRKASSPRQWGDESDSDSEEVPPMTLPQQAQVRSYAKAALSASKPDPERASSAQVEDLQEELNKERQLHYDARKELEKKLGALQYKHRQVTGQLQASENKVFDLTGALEHAESISRSLQHQLLSKAALSSTAASSTTSAPCTHCEQKQTELDQAEEIKERELNQLRTELASTRQTDARAHASELREQQQRFMKEISELKMKLESSRQEHEAALDQRKNTEKVLLQRIHDKHTSATRTLKERIAQLEQHNTSTSSPAKTDDSGHLRERVQSLTRELDVARQATEAALDRERKTQEEYNHLVSENNKSKKRSSSKSELTEPSAKSSGAPQKRQAGESSPGTISLDKHDLAIAALKEAHKTNLASQQEAQAADVKSRVDSAVRQARQSMSREHKEEMDALKQSHKRKHEDLVRRHKEELSSAIDEHKRDMTAFKKEQVKLQHSREEKDKKIIDHAVHEALTHAQREHAAELTSLKVQHKKDLAAQDKVAKEVTLLKQTHKHDVEALTSEATKTQDRALREAKEASTRERKKEVASLKHGHEKEISALKHAHEKAVEKAVSEVRAQMTSAHKQDLTDLSHEHKTEMDAARVRFQQQQEQAVENAKLTLAKEHKTELADFKAQRKKESQSLTADAKKAGVDEGRAAAEKEHRHALKELSAKHEKELQTVQSERKLAMAKKIEEVRSELGQEHKKSIATLQANHKKAMTELSVEAGKKEEAAIRTAKADQALAHKKEIQSLTTRLDTLQKSHEEALVIQQEEARAEQRELLRKLETAETVCTEQRAILKDTHVDLSRARADLDIANSQRANAERSLDTAREKLAMAARVLESMRTAMRQTRSSTLNTLAALRAEMVVLRGECVEYQRALSSELTATLTVTLKDVGNRAEEYRAKYRKERELRRKWYNMVQELRGNIRVYARVRPVLAHDGPRAMAIVSFPESSALVVHAPFRDHAYEFDHVFSTESSQKDVFAELKPLVTSVVDGYNVCVFAYGQTGSGKTHTMEGPASDPGIYTRTLQELFAVCDEQTDTEVTIEVAMTEIYNEQVYDLLDDNPRASRLEVRGIGSSVRVVGQTRTQVYGASDVLELLTAGARHRSVAITNVHEHSSRSHCLLSIYVKAYNSVSEVTSHGKLHLIDLAGSERVKRSQATGATMKEAQAINKSLSALGDVISALGKPPEKRGHVPFRNSKLTSLLSDSLGGDSKVLMMVCVAPSETNESETICSLSFASRVNNVELGAAHRHLVQASSNPKTPGK